MTRDECLIQELALSIGCKAVVVRGALDMPDYPPTLLATRRDAFLRQMREGQTGSDGLWNTPSQKEQLDDAGFGSFGPM